MYHTGTHCSFSVDHEYTITNMTEIAENFGEYFQTIFITYNQFTNICTDTCTEIYNTIPELKNTNSIRI